MVNIEMHRVPFRRLCEALYLLSSESLLTECPKNMNILKRTLRRNGGKDRKAQSPFQETL